MLARILLSARGIPGGYRHHLNARQALGGPYECIGCHLRSRQHRAHVSTWVIDSGRVAAGTEPPMHA